ncbi:hypothetical protein EDB84DRAFT_346740 [Lactarius hengduanensis]|nr:hypothetical protein EDB84DRAFT_346740 [Lactarius hengduanensis]
MHCAVTFGARRRRGASEKAHWMRQVSRGVFFFFWITSLTGSCVLPTGTTSTASPSFLGSITARSLDSQVKRKLSFMSSSLSNSGSLATIQRRWSLLDQVKIVLTPPSDRGRYTSAWKGTWDRARRDMTTRACSTISSDCSASNTPNCLPSRSSDVLSCARRSDQSYIAIEQAAPNRRRPRISHSLYGILYADGFISADRFQSSHAAPFIFVGAFTRKESGEARTRVVRSSVKSLRSSPELQSLSVPACVSTGLVSKYRIVVTGAHRATQPEAANATVAI